MPSNRPQWSLACVLFVSTELTTLNDRARRTNVNQSFLSFETAVAALQCLLEKSHRQAPQVVLLKFALRCCSAFLVVELHLPSELQRILGDQPPLWCISVRDVYNRIHKVGHVWICVGIFEGRLYFRKQFSSTPSSSSTLKLQPWSYISCVLAA